MEGRGRIEDHPNVRIHRIGADYATYVESLAEPVGLVGWSAGAGHAGPLTHPDVLAGELTSFFDESLTST